ncbi:TolC family outer membrane protein [Enterovibrio sp. ZSDZ35]|uniref:TolC family outer membrane protein n=1 Tax=Enterovibrio qingdaonensis TaxID=2899818 RepID=A0ABT5QIN7_9GAMM|nr:TolC family outer membrane protein [Enterovibrio sp. ZSDZ35]MDD1780851.1 TolC family outer membrane protein [Enterovibrio sp. ZSDZ35]
MTKSTSHKRRRLANHLSHSLHRHQHNRDVIKLFGYATLALALLLPSLSANAQSLEQAVATTLTQNPLIKEAYNEYKSRYENIDVSTGGYLPSIDLEAGIGYSDYNNDSNKGTYDPRDVRISLRQLIWDGSITYNDIQRTKAEAEAQRYQLLADAQDTALSVVEVYLEVLRTQQILDLTHSNLTTHEEITADVKKLADSGVSSSSDLTQAQGRLAQAHANVLAAQSNLDDKITEFEQIVGSSPDSLVTPAVDALFIPSSLVEALNLAKESNPVIKVALHDVDAAKHQYNQAKGDMYPTFTIEASQEWGEELDGTPGDTDEFQAMLRMRYNLFNGGSDAAESRSAAYQINKAKNIRNNAHRLLKESTRLAWSAKELADQQTSFLQQHVDAASDTLVAYEKQYLIGRRTLLDLLNTENELFDARRSYLDAHFSGILARYRVLNATGLLLSELRVETPEEWQTSVYGSNNEGDKE